MSSCACALGLGVLRLRSARAHLVNAFMKALTFNKLKIFHSSFYLLVLRNKFMILMYTF